MSSQLSFMILKIVKIRIFLSLISVILFESKLIHLLDTYYPSYDEETKLLKEVYAEAGIDPTQVNYVEVNGSCNVDADAQEVNSIADVFCRNRDSPLMIGSVKTNVGNTETASGMASKTSK